MSERKRKSAEAEKKASGRKEHKKLTKMRANPKDDWNIKDIETVANSLGIDVFPGSKHFAASSPLLHGQLTIPAKRPIKPFYIRNFVEMCDAHVRAAEDRQDDGS